MAKKEKFDTGHMLEKIGGSLQSGVDYSVRRVQSKELQLKKAQEDLVKAEKMRADYLSGELKHKLEAIVAKLGELGYTHLQVETGSYYWQKYAYARKVLNGKAQEVTLSFRVTSRGISVKASARVPKNGGYYYFTPLEIRYGVKMVVHNRELDVVLDT